MKVAVMVRGYLPSPRPTDMVYAPIDLAVAISKHLTERNHTIDYFGPEGTKLSTPVETLGLRALARNQNEFHKLFENPELVSHNILGLWDQYLAKEMFERARKGEYDILHFHHAEAALPYAKLYPDVPVVYTLHDPLSTWYQEIITMHQSPNQFYISISNNQRQTAPNLSFLATVYNGIDTSMFSFDGSHDGYLLYVGRMVPEKGAREAIAIAQRTGERLVMIGPTFPDHMDYFNQHVKPHLNDKIKYLGFKQHDQVVQYFKRAKAFLMPIQWDEPFGLTMVEAMACGTPVVALRRGSVTEVVEDGVTGFIVDTVDDMVAAIGKLDAISPSACCEHAQAKFSHHQMADGYEAAFKKALVLHKQAQDVTKAPKPGKS